MKREVGLASKRMLDDGEPLDEVAQIASLTRDEVQHLDSPMGPLEEKMRQRKFNT